MIRHVSLLHNTLGLATKDLIKIMSNVKKKEVEQKVEVALDSAVIKRKKSIDLDVEVESSEDEERNEMKLEKRSDRRKRKADKKKEKEVSSFQVKVGKSSFDLDR